MLIEELRSEAKEQILSLKDGEYWVSSETSYFDAEVWFKNDLYFLFEANLASNCPRYHGSFYKCELDALVSVFESWT